MEIKKNIAFVIYSLESGGAERVVSTLANYFVDFYNVTIISILKSNAFYPLKDSVNLEYCSDKKFNSKGFLNAIVNNIKLVKTIRKHLKENQINVSLSFMTTSNVLSIIACKTLKIPCIISERSNPYIYTHNSFWNNLIRLTYPKVDFLIVQTSFVKNYYREFVSLKKIRVLANPISADLIAAKSISTAKRNIILNVGRLDSNKAQDHLIKSFANINHDNWKLVFVGDGELRDFYEDLVKNLDLANDVIFTGNLANVESFYNSASIFAFTSKSEGFPNALIEGMYFELACISTDCPTGPSEIIHDGKNGFLIDVGDQTQLEKKLEKLIRNPMLREKLGKEAFLSVKSFETSNVAEQWHKLIISVL